MTKDFVGDNNQLVNQGAEPWAVKDIEFISGMPEEQLNEILAKVRKRYIAESRRVFLGPKRLKEFDGFVKTILASKDVSRLTTLGEFLSGGGVENNSANIILLAELTTACGCNLDESKSLVSLNALLASITPKIHLEWKADYQGRINKMERDAERQRELQRSVQPLDNIVLFEDAALAADYKKKNSEILVFSVELGPKENGWLLKEHSATRVPIFLSVDLELSHKLDRYKRRVNNANVNLYRELQLRCQSSSEAFFKKCIPSNQFDSNHITQFPKNSYVVTKNQHWKLYYISPLNEALAIEKKQCPEVFDFLDKQPVAPEALTCAQLQIVSKLIWNFIPSTRLTLAKKNKLVINFQPREVPHCNVINKFNLVAVNDFLKQNHHPFELVLTKKNNAWKLYYIAKKTVIDIDISIDKYQNARQILAEWDNDELKAWGDGSPNLGCEPGKISDLALKEFKKTIGTLAFNSTIAEKKINKMNNLFAAHLKLREKAAKVDSTDLVGTINSVNKIDKEQINRLNSLFGARARCSEVLTETNPPAP